jgi:hypothetical protein
LPGRISSLALIGKVRSSPPHPVFAHRKECPSASALQGQSHAHSGGSKRSMETDYMERI